MKAPSKARRRRFAGHQHRIDSRPPALEQRTGQVQVSPVPDEVVWKVAPGSLDAHAFSSGPGWMRSACRQERWTAAIAEPPEDAKPCDECWELVAGAAS